MQPFIVQVPLQAMYQILCELSLQLFQRHGHAELNVPYVELFAPLVA